MRRTNPAPQPVHWSKDYVEHLRTVHFALIATATALIIVALTTKPYSTAVAAREVRQIQDLRNHWSPEFVRDQLRNTGVYGKDFPWPKAAGKRYHTSFHIDPKVKVLYARVGLDDAPNPQVYFVHLPDKYWDDNCVDSHMYPNPLDKKPPDTVAGFRDWWNSFQKTCYAFFPTVVDVGDILGIGIYTELNLLNDDELSQLGHKFMKKDANVELVAHHDGNGDYVAYQREVGPTMLPGAGTQLRLIPTAYFRADLNVSLLAAHMGLKSIGSFSESFRDLDDVAKVNGIESLDALQDTLAKVEPSETPVFEAFGIKFPADLATIGGMVVLVGVQLYFLVYLRKLDGTLTRADAGWDVPWVGMDSSVLARLIFFITVCVFPCLSLLVLGSEADVRLTRGYWGYLNGSVHVAPISGWHWTIDVKIIATIIPIFMSAYLGGLGWKYRPEVTNAGDDLPGVASQTFADKPDAQVLASAPGETQETDQG